MNEEIQFLLYSLPEEEGNVQVIIKDETIWATQNAMAQLFGVGVGGYIAPAHSRKSNTPSTAARKSDIWRNNYD